MSSPSGRAMPMRPGPQGARFATWHAVAAYVGAFLLSTFCAPLLLIVAGYGGVDQGEWPLWLIAVVQVPMWIGLTAGVVIVSRRFGTGKLRDDYGLARPRWTDAAIGLPLGVAAQAVFVPLLYRALWFLDSEQLGKPAEELTNKADFGAGLVLLVLLVVIGAPLIEELFFRGLLLRALQARYSNLIALVGSSLLFGVAHLQPLQLPALVMFGLLAGALAQRTRHLAMPVFAHVGFNLTTVVVLTLRLTS